MEILYAALFFFGMIVLFYAIPWLIHVLKVQSRRRGYNVSNVEETDTVLKTDDMATKYKEPAILVDPIYLPEPSGKADKKLEPTKEMVDMYYKNDSSDVPEQYCKKPIGACPDSKPMSTDLPIANIPMCMAVQKDNMRLIPRKE